MVVRPTELCSPQEAQPCSAHTRPVTHPVWHHTPPIRRTVRSGQRIADRRCAAAGAGRKGAMESAGLVFADVAFQGCYPIGCAIHRAVPT